MKTGHAYVKYKKSPSYKRLIYKHPYKQTNVIIVTQTSTNTYKPDIALGICFQQWCAQKSLQYFTVSVGCSYFAVTPDVGLQI
jgi:outer membrane lipoprotein-sorting protein